MNRHKITAEVTEEMKHLAESTTKKNLLWRHRINFSIVKNNATKSLNNTENSTIHSRLFFRKNKVNFTTPTTDVSITEPTSNFTDQKLSHNDISEENVTIIQKHRFKSRSEVPVVTQSRAGIGNFYKNRRLSSSTVTENSADNSTTTNPFNRVNSRYFARNRKTSSTESIPTTTENIRITTSRGRFIKNKFIPKGVIKTENFDSNENNRNAHSSTASVNTVSTIFDQISSSNLKEEEKILNKINLQISTVFDKFKETKLSTELPLTTTEMNESSSQKNQNLNTAIHIKNFSNNSKFEKNFETSSENIFSRINIRNNSRFLKNPEAEYLSSDNIKESKVQELKRYPAETNDKNDSPIFVKQKKNETQIEFEIQVKHVNNKSIKPNKNSEQPKSRSLNFTDEKSIQPLQSRGKHRFSDDIFDSNAVSINLTKNRDSSEFNNFASKPATRLHYSSLNKEVTSVEVTTKRMINKNRGSIKAKNSLSKAEIKEFVSLIDVPSNKFSNHHQIPINKIEETSNFGNEFRRNFNSSRSSTKEKIYLPKNYAYSTIYTLPNINDRIFEETTDLFYEYILDENAAVTDSLNANLIAKDVFRVSETKYNNEKIHLRNDSWHIGKSKSQQNIREERTDEAEQPSFRIRGNFRRNNSTYTRLKASTSTTTTTEYAPHDINNLSIRFRRRKGRPENRSINTARNENFIPLSSTEISTGIRHKNNDITHRGSTQISDYLPVPAPLYRLNNSNFNQLNANNINLEDEEVQTTGGSTEYYSDDISDLANPAVAAISNLKTVPPVSLQRINMKTIASIIPEIMYTKEIPKEEFHVIKSTQKTTIAIPVYQHKQSKYKGPIRGSSRTTTTTQLPSLQDIYNDYQDSDIEYHADPVEIPITGKVRIHSDGYIECLDMGNFPHPFSCKKFISCAKMEYDNLLGWEYTCPKGLSFDPIGGICNWAAGLGCKE